MKEDQDAGDWQAENVEDDVTPRPDIWGLGVSRGSTVCSDAVPDPVDL